MCEREGVNVRACEHVCMSVCVCACVRACVYANMRACVCVCMRACVCVGGGGGGGGGRWAGGGGPTVLQLHKTPLPHCSQQQRIEHKHLSHILQPVRRSPTGPHLIARRTPHTLIIGLHTLLCVPSSFPWKCHPAKPLSRGPEHRHVGH